MENNKYKKYLKNILLISDEYSISINFKLTNKNSLILFYYYGLVSLIYHKIVKVGYLPGVNNGYISKISNYLIFKIISNIKLVNNTDKYSEYVYLIGKLKKYKLITFFIPNTLVGSPQVFYTIPLYSLILKYKNNLKLIGIVHGGGYGIFKKYKYTYIEKTISNEYYG